MAYIVIVYIVMAYIVMAYIVLTCIVMAYYPDRYVVLSLQRNSEVVLA